jgi:hypothetical protein
VLLALIGEAQHDAATAASFGARYLDPRRERERAMLKAGIATGELPVGLPIISHQNAQRLFRIPGIRFAAEGGSGSRPRARPV